MPDVNIRLRAANLTKQAFAEVFRDLDRIGVKVKQVDVATEKWQGGMRSLIPIASKLTAVLGAAGLTLSLGGFAKGAIEASIRMESMRAGLVSVTGSAGEAERQLVRLREIARDPGLSFEQAVNASLNLQAVGLNAELAERATREMANALAIVGRSNELPGVVLAMTQMAGQGKILQEEINQIASRIPQFRKAMIDAFGTARSEDIQKMGISAEDFLSRITEQFSKMGRANIGAAASISNLQNAFTQFQATVGDTILPAFTAAVQRLESVLLRATAAMRGFGGGESAAEIQSRIAATREELAGIQPMRSAFPILSAAVTGARRAFLERRLESLETQLAALTSAAPAALPAIDPLARFGVARTIGRGRGLIESPSDRAARQQLQANQRFIAQRALEQMRLAVQLEQRLQSQTFPPTPALPGVNLGAANLGGIIGQPSNAMRNAFAGRGFQFGMDILGNIGVRRAAAGRLQEQLVQLERDRQREIEAIQQDETRSIREKARAIEAIERASARRRRQIESDLAEAQKGFFRDVADAFLAEARRMLGRAAAGAAIGAIVGSIVPGIGTAVGAQAGALAGIGVSDTSSLGFDNPLNDLMAMRRGRLTAAQLSNPRRAAFAVGQNSAPDLLRNFEAGFASGARNMSFAGGAGTIQIFLDGESISTDRVVTRFSNRTSNLSRQGRL